MKSSLKTGTTQYSKYSTNYVVQSFMKYIRTGSAKWPMGRKQPTPCFCVAHELRIFFAFLIGYKKHKKKNICGMLKLYETHISVSIKSYYNTVVFLHVHMVYDCFHVKTAVKWSQGRPKLCMAHKA